MRLKFEMLDLQKQFSNITVYMKETPYVELSFLLLAWASSQEQMPKEEEQSFLSAYACDDISCKLVAIWKSLHANYGTSTSDRVRRQNGSPFRPENKMIEFDGKNGLI